MKKYKLLKDLPGKKAGEVVSVCEEAGGTVTWCHNGVVKITISVLIPEYFEEVKEPREFELVICKDGRKSWGGLYHKDEISEVIKVREVLSGS